MTSAERLCNLQVSMTKDPWAPWDAGGCRLGEVGVTLGGGGGGGGKDVQFRKRHLVRIGQMF